VRKKKREKESEERPRNKEASGVNVKLTAVMWNEL
jgi:hypothetical protein